MRRSCIVSIKQFRNHFGLKFPCSSAVLQSCVSSAMLIAMSTRALLLLSVLGVVCAKEPGWRVGWGFDSHGGFPIMPWQRYQMNQSAVGYFLGNASGMESHKELMAESRLGVVGLGWQLSNIPSHYSNLEVYELEEARRLKSMRPDVKVMLTRETEVTTFFYNMSKEKMYNPDTQDFWTQCGGKPCKGVWGSPAGNTPKYFFNFSNPRLADWWVNEFVIGAAKNDLIDGIYFDCSCGAPPGDGLDQEKMQEDAQKSFDRAVQLLAGMGKWASAWNSPAGSIRAGATCASQMRQWIAQGIADKNTLQIQVNKQVEDQEIAAFLIARGPSAVMEFPVLGAYGAAVEYGWNPLMDEDFGVPLDKATENPAHVFTRRWSNATISLNCAMWKATFSPAESIQPLSASIADTSAITV